MGNSLDYLCPMVRIDREGRRAKRKSMCPRQEGRGQGGHCARVKEDEEVQVS